MVRTALSTSRNPRPMTIGPVGSSRRLANPATEVCDPSHHEVVRWTIPEAVAFWATQHDHGVDLGLGELIARRGFWCTPCGVGKTHGADSHSGENRSPLLDRWGTSELGVLHAAQARLLGLVKFFDAPPETVGADHIARMLHGLYGLRRIQQPFDGLLAHGCHPGLHSRTSCRPRGKDREADDGMDDSSPKESSDRESRKRVVRNSANSL